MSSQADPTLTSDERVSREQSHENKVLHSAEKGAVITQGCASSLHKDEGAGPPQVQVKEVEISEPEADALAAPASPPCVANPLTTTRISVKILDASSLPSSSTSTSSPESLLKSTVWVGGLHEAVDNSNEKRVQSTTCKGDMDSPRFDADFIFPLSVESIEDILSGCVAVTLSDVKLPGESSETTLGSVKIPFSTMFRRGKVLSGGVQLSPAFYELNKGKSAGGKIRLSLSFFMGNNEDIDKFCSGCKNFVELVHEIKRASSTGTASAAAAVARGRSRRRLNSCSPSRRSRSRGGGGSRHRARGSPQKPNKLERIVLASSRALSSCGQPRYAEEALEEPLELDLSLQEEEVRKERSSSKKCDYDREREEQHEKPQGSEGELIAPDEKENGKGINQLVGDPTPSPEVDTKARSQQAERDPEPKKERRQHEHDEAALSSPPPSRNVHEKRPPSPRPPFVSSTSVIHGSIHRHQELTSLGRKAASAWKNHLLKCLVKLEDKDTLSRSLGEVHQIIQMMQPHQVQPFLYQISRQPKTVSLLTRRSMLDLVSYVCFVHPQATATTKTMNLILDIILSAARGVEEALRDDCVSAMSSCVRHSFPNSAYAPSAKGGVPGGLSSMLENMFSVFSEQSLTTKETSGACIAAAIEPLDVSIPLTISGNIRSMEDLRHALRPTKIPLPKSTVIIANRMALLFVRGRQNILAMHEALSSAILPANYKVEPLTRLEAFYLNQSDRRHAAALASNCNALLGDIVSALGRSSPGSGTDTTLYRCCKNFARAAFAHKEEHPSIHASVSKSAPYLINKAIQSLNSKNKKHWKEKFEAMHMITWLCRAGCNEQYIAGRHTVVVNAVNRSKAGVKAVRDSAAEALEELEGLRARALEANRGGNGVARATESDEEREVEFHDMEEPPPIKFEPEYEPDLGGSVARPPKLDIGEDKDDGGDGSYDGERKEDNGSEGLLQDVIKKGRRKYRYQQRRAGGVRSPRESTGGSGIATVRLLKELGNKSVAMQRSLDDLAQVTRDKMENIGKRVKEIEVEVKQGAAGVAQAAQQREHQKMQQRLQEPSAKERFFLQRGVDIRKEGGDRGSSVSLWREIQWLLHCNELETAYQTCLNSNTEGMLMRLINETGICCERVSTPL